MAESLKSYATQEQIAELDSKIGTLHDIIQVTFTPSSEVSVITQALYKYGRLTFGTLWITVSESKRATNSVLGTFSHRIGVGRWAGFERDSSADVAIGFFKTDNKTLTVDNNYGLRGSSYRITFIGYD